MIQQFHFWVFIKKPQNPPLIKKDICTPMFVAALLVIAKIWKLHRYSSTDAWIRKM